MKTFVMEFGCRQPTVNEELIHEQYWLAHRCYNAMVEVERGYRALIKETQSRIPSIAAGYAEVNEAGEQYNLLWKQLENKDEESQEVKEARSRLKELRNGLKELKDEHLEELQPEYDLLREKRAAELRGVYHEFSNLFWGTKNKTRAAFDAACKKPKLKKGQKKRKKSKRWTPWELRPAFRRWLPGRPPQGLIAVQLQKKPLVEALFNGDTNAQFDPLDKDAFNYDLKPKLTKGQRKRLQYTTFRLRIGSDEKSKPIWGEWPVFLHRPFPPKARVSNISVIRVPFNQVFRFRWWVQLTLEVPDEIPKRRSGVVAVNIGWRKMWEDELRVGTWVGSDGDSGELRLGKTFCYRMRHAREIRGTRDTLLDNLKVILDEEGFSVKWRSHERFHQLLAGREEGPAPLTDRARAALKEWAFRDRHLWWFERGERTGARRYRKEQYRLLAKKLAERYLYVVIEDYDLTPIVEDPSRKKDPSRQRVEGAPSQFRQVLHSTTSRVGGIAIDGKSKLATQICHLCGCREKWNAAPRVMHTCTCCGHTWDQDINNASNMLARAMKGIAAGTLKAKGKKPSKFHKRHKKGSTEE